ncbi:hypothetical protein C8F04DRAFT_1190637 [Mycena alexandri]|uniref:Uncharacterized protein n=1 Tax=Mycena alexandri TaxID=1745969 RepID=A0AAD6WT91_9AGAR|nr:hypothetical protein C8F04DRAFT_1190637 [Mycena alexandri]
MSSNQLPQQQDPNQWVSSPKGAFYWQHTTGSYWKGPADDRVWVPSMDSPLNLPPPPDFGAPQGNAAGAPPATQFGTSTPIPLGRLNVQMPLAYQQREPVLLHSGVWYGLVHRPAEQQTGFMSMAPRPPTQQMWWGDAPHTQGAHIRPTAFRPWGTQGATGTGNTAPEARREPWDVSTGRLSPKVRLARRENHRAQTHELQDRARDQQLRDRALSSRPSSTSTHDNITAAAPVRPLAPKVEDTEIGSDGHPILPGQAVPSDESDYGGSSEEDEGPEALKKFQVRETFRHREAVQKKQGGLLGNPGKAVRAPGGETVGVWGTLQYDTIPAARSLIRWMLTGYPRARAMFVYLRDFFGQNPTERRPDGIQFLLHQQNSTERTWLYNTTGDSTPRSRCNPNQPPASRSRNERRRAKKRKDKGALPVFGPVGSSQPHNNDDPMPEPQEDIFERSYLGESPAFEGEDPNIASHSLASLMATLAQISRQNPRTWTGSARLIDGEWPSPTSPVGSRMLPDDARATRFLNFIAAIREDTSVNRSRFITRAVGRSIAPPRTLPVRVLQPHPDQHGIAPGTTDARALHGFAASWRNRNEGNTHPTGQEFTGQTPRNTIEVLSWPDSRLVEWRQLQHRPVRRGISTTYPRHPASAAFGPPGPAPAPEIDMPAALE